MGQSVRTVNIAEAERPLVSPVAVIVWSPGGAAFGLLVRFEKLPDGSVVAFERTLPSQVMSTTSDEPKALPETVTREPGGLTVGESRSLGPTACACVTPNSGQAIISRTIARTPRVLRLVTSMALD